MEYNEYIQNMTLENPKLTVGDDVIVLVEYSLCVGKVLKVNRKNIKVHVFASWMLNEYIKSFRPEKVLKFGTPAALVWETWKGVNGRGSYRLDTKMYLQCLKPVEKIGRSRYLYEYEFGKLENNTEKNYMC